MLKMISRTELIEIQYEIAMSIGSSLDLKKMLRGSLSTILRRLNCPIGGILIREECDLGYTLVPNFSIPKNALLMDTIKLGLSSLNDTYSPEAYMEMLQSLPSKVSIETDGTVHILELPNFGILFLYTPDDYLSPEILGILPPLMNKLSIACKACIQNTELDKHRNNLMQLVTEQTRDITDQKNKLEEVNQELIDLNATKNKFFSIIAHDLKSPFNGIIGLADALIHHIHELDSDQVVHHISQIHSNGTKTFRLLENLLSWSRIQTGKIPFEPEILDLKELVESNIELQEYGAQKKEIVIRSELDKPVLVMADKSMINTILRNLISNAVKFTPCSGVITVRCSQKRSRVKISIQDSGVGMSKERVDKLFRIDESVSTKGTNNEKGTGLGLILCSEFVKQHNGSIEVESEPDLGSTFSFSLPISQ